MVRTHNLGFPRIGAKRELKFALENYWRGALNRQELLSTGNQLQQRHWQHQSRLDLAPVGDFAYYDHVLDMSFTLGNLPERAKDFHGEKLDNYFRVARGQSASGEGDHASCCAGIAASEMTKWFDTNYHYIVPEFSCHTQFQLDASRLLEQLAQAREQGIQAKPVIIGPVTYLALGKAKDDSNKLDLLKKLLPIYEQLLNVLSDQGVEWVQIDEPILVTELDSSWQQAFNTAYHHLKTCPVKLLLTTYFGRLAENTYLAANLPVAGLHVDGINAKQDIVPLLNLLPSHKILSLGVINGRNIWKTDLHATLDWLEPIAQKLQDRLWLAPSCSLLHVPVDLESEQHLDPEIKSWLAFALQKLDELTILATAINKGHEAVKDALTANRAAIASRHQSTRVNNPIVKARLQK